MSNNTGIESSSPSLLAQVVTVLSAVAVFGLPLLLIGAVSFERYLETTYKLDTTTAWRAVGVIAPIDLTVHALNVASQPKAFISAGILACILLYVLVGRIALQARRRSWDRYSGQAILPENWATALNRLYILFCLLMIGASLVSAVVFSLFPNVLIPEDRAVRLPPNVSAIYWAFVILSIFTFMRASISSSLLYRTRLSHLPKALFWTVLFAYGAFLVPLAYSPQPGGYLLPHVTVECHTKEQLSGELLAHKDEYWHILVTQQRMIVSIPDEQSGRVVMSQPTGQPCLR